MRVHQITCPECGSGMKSKAGIPVGQRIPCPKCKAKFTVEAPDEADIVDDADVVDDEFEVVDDFDDDEPAPKKKGPPPAPGKKKSARRMEEDETEEEEIPRKKSAGVKSKKSRRDDDDDTEERPIKKKKKKRRDDDDEEDENLFLKLKHNIFVRIITLVVLLGILAVAAYLLYKKRMDEAKDTSSLNPVKVAMLDRDR